MTQNEQQLLAAMQDAYEEAYKQETKLDDLLVLIKEKVSFITASNQ